MRYRDLTVEELQAQIAQYRTAKMDALSGGVATVQAEGRRVDYVQANSKGLDAELRELEAELARRPGFEDRRQWALGVELYR